MTLWLPIDAYFGLGFSKHRLLHVPTITDNWIGPDHVAYRFEFRFIVYAHCIVDFKRVPVPRCIDRAKTQCSEPAAPHRQRLP